MTVFWKGQVTDPAQVLPRQEAWGGRAPGALRGRRRRSQSRSGSGTPPHREERWGKIIHAVQKGINMVGHGREFEFIWWNLSGETRGSLGRGSADVVREKLAFPFRIEGIPELDRNTRRACGAPDTEAVFINGVPTAEGIDHVPRHWRGWDGRLADAGGGTAGRRRNQRRTLRTGIGAPGRSV